MSEEVPQANPPLSTEEELAAAKLTDADFAIIDAAILANASNHWFKVARVVARTEDSLKNRYPALTYAFYAQHLITLVEQGRLESLGIIEYMRFSEVRIPTQSR